jgi:trigger factor
VRRGKALAAVVHAATVKDTAGNIIDTDEFFGPKQQAAGAEDKQDEEAAEDKQDEESAEDKQDEEAADEVPDDDDQ